MGLTSVLDRATWAAKHPLEATAQTIGVLKGAASAATDLIGRATSHEPTEARSAPVVPAQTSREEPLVEPVPAAEQRPPEPPQESFATEPSAVTRESAHGARGDDASLDDWYGTYDDDVPEGVVASLELGDRGELVDEAAIKAELSRSEIARRGAERDPDRQ